MHRRVVMATVKVGVVTFPKLLERKSYCSKLRFEVVYNSHFYNYYIYRSVVVATVNMGVVTKSRILVRKSYCW